jgi:hypothetical protein
VGEAGERRPAHQQPVGLRKPAASPCEAKLTTDEISGWRRSEKKGNFGLVYRRGARRW